MQTPKRRSDVPSCSGASDESGGCILDPLQWIDWRLRKCCQNEVAVVHSGFHKSRRQTRRDIGTEDSTDGFKAAKIEETGTDDGVCPYRVPPHIPEYCPFRLQTKQFHHSHILPESSRSYPYTSRLHTMPPSVLPKFISSNRREIMLIWNVL